MSNTATAYEVGHLYEVDPGALKIGANVRTDTRPDAKEFAASIKTRGVLEVISAYVDPDGSLTVLRGQRRSLVAAKVGTPDRHRPGAGRARPEEVDRIIDQASENLHRAGHARPRDPRRRRAAGHARRLGRADRQARRPPPRHRRRALTVVTRNPATKERMDATGMTLEEAAIFAEFEDDPDAIDTLTRAWEDPGVAARCRTSCSGCATSEPRPGAAGRGRPAAQPKGLPVLDPNDVPADLHRHRHGQPAHRRRPARPGGAVARHHRGAVAVTVEWSEPDDETDDDDDEPTGPSRSTSRSGSAPTPPPLACTTPTVGREPTDTTGEVTDERSGRAAGEAEARREAESAERRRVIANNKAWKAAEVVRREWLTGLFARRTVPAGPRS
jgi:ParB family chromosome partitioning protein